MSRDVNKTDEPEGIDRGQLLKRAGAVTIALGSIPFLAETAWAKNDDNDDNDDNDEENHDNNEENDDNNGEEKGRVRWDIINLAFTTPLVVSEGGPASALANDGSKITLTGSGTFRSNGGDSENVTGGGNWTTFAAAGGATTGSGTYKVKKLVSFVLAPGTQVALTDTIGPVANSRAGLAVLRVAYSDGSEGVLVVSCHLGGAVVTPDSVFEGITASKGFVDYWNRVAPVTGVAGGRTNFHIL